ncbi:MAG: HEPN domain-containing protein [Gammaproteobacteria bacterium]
MTVDELARDYLRRARIRRAVLDLLYEAAAYPDVVREAQELVELALKGMLRWAGVDPPKWHDVGEILLAQQARLPPELGPDLPVLARISRRLRKERELAFYGEIDLIPGQAYDEAQARTAIADADTVLAALRYFT